MDESVYFQASELGIPLAQICKYTFSSINFYWERDCVLIL